MSSILRPTTAPSNGAWMECRPDPCPVCGHSGWCSVSPDGAVCACKRVAEGAFSSRETSAGWVNHYHRLRDPLPGDRHFRPEAGPSRAHADFLHDVYTALLSRLGLSKAHRKALRRRGLTGEEIDRRQYATMPPPPERRSAAGWFAAGATPGQLELLAKVPGFVPDGEGVQVVGASGIVVPVRDDLTRIVALVIRQDDPGGGAKYVWLSSRRHGGPGPGAPVHWPHAGLWVERHGVGALRTVRITEGQLKADIATALGDTYTLGFPGATAWRLALEALRRTGYDARVVRIAFDRDAATNEVVAKAQLECARAVAEMGLKLEVETW